MSLNITALRQQHHDAEQIAADIISIIASFRNEYDAIPIARQIGKLNALLRIHLAYEDSVLYPSLIDSGDDSAAALAHEFWEHSGAVAEQFEDFARRWSGPTVIAAMFDAFREEAATLFATLGARIERENDLLFPLVARLTLQRAA